MTTFDLLMMQEIANSTHPCVEFARELYIDGVSENNRGYVRMHNFNISEERLHKQINKVLNTYLNNGHLPTDPFKERSISIMEKCRGYNHYAEMYNHHPEIKDLTLECVKAFLRI